MNRNPGWYSQALCMFGCHTPFLVPLPLNCNRLSLIRGTLLNSTVFSGVDISSTLVAKAAGTLCSTPALGGYRGDGVAGITRRRRDLSSDGVRDLTTASELIMEFLVKIYAKARILELKRRHLKNLSLTTNTPYLAMKIRRIRACTSPNTTNTQELIRLSANAVNRSIGTELPRPDSGTYMASRRISFEELWVLVSRAAVIENKNYVYSRLYIVPSDFDVDDAFSSTNTPDYIPASPDYSPASPGNTSSDPLEDLSKDLLASLAISPFHDDPYMKVMQAYNATSNKSPIPLPRAPIAPSPVLPSSPVLSPSPLFDPRDFFLPEEILPP
ncbi:hypothetical protein Tco_0343659 [Tanacetum coccineum]